ncbi:MAG: hypothetical protein Q9225_003768 [Loekoesia sp. 1 TL-2023]
MEVPPHRPFTSRFIEGAFHFSKLWLYYSTWTQEWEFVLQLLHAKLGKWLSYLRNTQHMANLWVARQEDVILKPHDTISPGNGSIYRTCPQYHLSDFTTLWITLNQLEELVDSIERNPDLQRRSREDLAKCWFNELRQIFDSHRKILGIQTVRSNILETFVVSKRGEISNQLNTYEKTATNPEATEVGESPITITINTSENPRTSAVPAIKVENSVLDSKGSEPDQRIIAFQRTISDYIWEIQPSDIATIEAATFGFFDKSNDQISSAWRETLKKQKDSSIQSFQEPRQLALAWFAARSEYVLTNSPQHVIEDICRKKLVVALYDSGAFARRIVDDAPESLRSWSAEHYETLSILMGCLFEECRPVL